MFSSSLASSETCSSASETWSRETSSLSSASLGASTLTSGWDEGDNSARSSFETWIFSGIFLALYEGRIGTPLFEISPL